MSPGGRPLSAFDLESDAALPMTAVLGTRCWSPKTPGATALGASAATTATGHPPPSPAQLNDLLDSLLREKQTPPVDGPWLIYQLGSQQYLVNGRWLRACGFTGPVSATPTSEHFEQPTILPLDESFFRSLKETAASSGRPAPSTGARPSTSHPR